MKAVIVMFKTSFRFLFYALLCLLISSPSLAKKGLSNVEKIHAEIIKATPIYDDPELTEYVSRIGEKLVEDNGLTDYEYKFFVLDSPDINAFTPGSGYIYMNRGLLTFMTSEAHLAGVLAHEIGHNVGRHISRRKTRNALGNVAAVAASVLTGNTGVGNSIALANAARLSGFGREMELEADEYAADYLYHSNYDPEEMLGVLGLLKDHERFNNIKNKSKGRVGTYHGVFSSHPRSDKRLQEVIKKAGKLPPGEGYRGRESMREVLAGVVFGENYNGNKKEGFERFTHNGLGITFLYPEDWSRTNKGKNIILKDANKTIQLKIELEKTVDKTLTSKQILEKKYPDDLTQVEAIDEKATKDLGTLAKRPNQRVAAITVSRNTYYFQGIAKNNKLTAEQDEQFLQIITSFRRATRKDLPPDHIKRIYYERLKPGQTFADLAKGNILGIYTEDYLRLINGYYPKGEPEPGTWMKLVRSEPLDPKKQSRIPEK